MSYVDRRAQDPEDLNHQRVARKLARRFELYGGGAHLSEVWHLRLAVALGLVALLEWIRDRR